MMPKKKPTSNGGAVGGLTRRQVEVLAYLRAFVARAGYSPSIAEIATGLKIKGNGTAARAVRALEERKIITRLAHRARAIEITAKGLAFRLPEPRP